MECLVVGEGALELHEINKALKSSPSYVEFIQKWKPFARNLCVNEAKLPGMERQINLGLLLLEDSPLEVLKIWRAEKGSAASLQLVCDALTDCGLLDIAELLETRFLQPKPSKLPNLILQGATKALDELLSEHTPAETRQHIVAELKKFSREKCIEIVKKEVSPKVPPKFYIARNFCYKNELDKKVFTAHETDDHVFVLEGISRPELARVVDFKPIEFSENQLQEVTMQYILLDLDEDYEQICRKTPKPVHLIQYKHDRFFWIKSSKKLHVIREFINDNEGKTCSEMEMIIKIESCPAPCAFSIADSPGMGKTVVLANLAFQIMLRNSNVVVIFLSLHEFVQKVERIQSSSDAIEAISSYAGVDAVSKLILREMFKNNSQHFYLCLDGYDEILETNRVLADSFLMHLKSVTNVKVVLTTRPHMKSRMESVFNQLSFEIHSFTESNQVEFLTKYWNITYGAMNGVILEKFARRCLKSLEHGMIDKERKIAGVPLQCWMLAEVLAKAALRASKLKHLRDGVTKLTSFFEMYKSLIDLKFSRIPENSREKYINAHVHASIVLLFPEWAQKFESYLNGYNKVDENLMYSIGLIEKSSSTSRPRFLHRTFAEYIFAGFIAKGLGKFNACVEFLYGEMFGEKGTNRLVFENGYDDYELKNPVIGYFIDTHLPDYKFDDSLLPNHSKGAKINDKDVCIAACTCCVHNLENFFDLTTIVIRCCNIKNREDLRDTYFKYLPFAAASISKNVSLYKKVVNVTKLEFGVDSNYHVWISKVSKIHCTPLHWAFLYWNYNVVSFLLNEYKNDVITMTGLLHFCVENSGRDSDAVIVEKLATIDLLLQLNPEWLTESIKGIVPILSYNVHVKILQRLVERGADINTYSKQHGTLLHGASVDGTQSSYREVVRWALDSGFKLINERNKNEQTCLVVAIFLLKVVDDDILRWFHEANADFRAQDKDGYSALHYAIYYSNNTDFIKKLIDYGGDVTSTSGLNETLAHHTIRYVKDPDQALSLLRLLTIKGFKKFNQKDHTNVTPLELAESRRGDDVELIDYIREQKYMCYVQ